MHKRADTIGCVWLAYCINSLYNQIKWHYRSTRVAFLLQGRRSKQINAPLPLVETVGFEPTNQAIRHRPALTNQHLVPKFSRLRSANTAFLSAYYRKAFRLVDRQGFAPCKPSFLLCCRPLHRVLTAEPLASTFSATIHIYGFARMQV